MSEEGGKGMEQRKEKLSPKEILEENRWLRQKVARQNREIIELKRELTYDPITELLQTQKEGRRRILERIEAIHKNRRKVGLIRLDLNNLKPWNERYGHDETDRILGHFGRELKGWAEARDGVAMRFHFKGDEFGILLPLANKDELTKVVRELDDFSLERPEGSISCSFTIGFAHEDELEVQEEISKLDIKENHLAKPGTLFTALSEIADKRERQEERRKKK